MQVWGTYKESCKREDSVAGVPEYRVVWADLYIIAGTTMKLRCRDCYDEGARRKDGAAKKRECALGFVFLQYNVMVM